MKDRKNTVAWKLDRAILFCFCIFIAVVFVGLIFACPWNIGNMLYLV